jgi:hypothetical protein
MTNNGFESKELYSYGTTGFDGVLVPVGSSRTCSVDDIVNLDLEVDEDILVDWCVYWDAVNEGLVFKGFKWTDMNTRDKPLFVSTYGYLSIDTGIRDIIVAANRYLGTTRMKRIGTSPDYVLTVEWNLTQRWIYNNYNKVSIAVSRCPIPGTKTALPAGRTDNVYRLCQNTFENTDENTGYKIEWVQGVKAAAADPLHAIAMNWSPIIICTAANVEVHMGLNNTTVDPAPNINATYQEALIGETVDVGDNRRLIGQLITDSSNEDVLEGLNWIHGLEGGSSTSPIYVGQEAGSALWGNIML